ncbi:Arc family DNA-binding protein [Phyllobacterium sp. K27]
MSDDQKYPSQLAERFQIRLPAGLRDRIKVYAERHGRSMNTEIVRILEREFPEPWSFEMKIDEIRKMIKALEFGIDENSINVLGNELRDTLKGIVTGRVYDFPDAGFEKVKETLERWDEIERQDAEDRTMEYLDEEEFESFQEHGTTAKIVFPEDPEFPDDGQDKK